MAIWLVPPEEEVGCAPMIDAVCALYHVERKQLFSRSRSQRTVMARQLGIFLCRELTMGSTTEIGKVFGRDHTTVIYAIAKMRLRRESSAPFRKTVDQILARLREAEVAA